MRIHGANVLVNRIRSANILLITVKALANEVAKNLVLAGIGSLTILDHESVTEADLDAQFFLEDAHKDPSIIAEGKKVRSSQTIFFPSSADLLTLPHSSELKSPVLKSTA